MSGKRRDNKGRVLHPGEYQDATGRYSYKYKDVIGVRRTVYSWSLIPTDRVPQGKKKDKCLRDKIKDIEKELSRGVWHDNINVLELVERYLMTKTGVRHSTRSGYKTVQGILAKEPFGQLPIHKVKLSDAKLFLIKLQREGKGYSTIHTIRGVLRSAFQMAVDDEMLTKNPFQFHLSTVVINDSVKREALSPADEKRFLEFVKDDPTFSRYYDGMFILFNTGLRISEFCGLTKRDIDFENGVIYVDHQLQRIYKESVKADSCAPGGRLRHLQLTPECASRGAFLTYGNAVSNKSRNMEYVVESTKTSCGTRRIPMSEEVREAFGRVIANREKVKKEPMIDGHSGFLFLDKDKKPMIAQHWQNYFKRAVQKYNSTHKLQLPPVTPHICRHTYCSKMPRAGMNPKALQYLMGHVEISVTMNVYTHLGEEDAKAEMMKIGLIEQEEPEIHAFQLS